MRKLTNYWNFINNCSANWLTVYGFTAMQCLDLDIRIYQLIWKVWILCIPLIPGNPL